ncbi:MULTISPECIES: SDR family oxidoreductase [Psychrobacter]|jgi:nucleoside-diphosphate-sugar epimerase|uniref:SDR family oxidoreductase n=1 Tax=Psychrobacter TaxID=497 RepID=UPI00086F0F57|nr:MULTISPECIES: SDR family oxidoreductase [Psychrobacter]MBA6244722.1 SDR family oxidoreductase [Psychrobacter sp. Urea-trap-18]MBA6285801.1 SDR family oxidoreductase [Psychrobacter sp. Urea-trap-16]MBA6318727.1 SDR family oxidoreductase [Psychrobacter sp. Urea-trap-20]MBA6334886.1 SDR family oxidoreductase [Psychrobacter sp. Urea-trap-19]OEH67380.1 MAG: NAD(P)-dependent oxidoreductase [Psychrobacter sp. B29-1]|tara:strand:+ start:4027 stop:4866 length:840 start_codon:yes stop_codon:yes gene_type:complete
MSTQNLLIIGQGDIGLPVTNKLGQDGYCVTGLARSEREYYDLVDSADFLQANALTLTAEQLQAFTHIAIIVTPDEYSTSGYHDSYLAISQHLATLADKLTSLVRVVFISSTGIYGQDSGEWIDEDTVPITPEREASKVILQAEQALQQGFGDKAIIIRPSGIYGRERLMRLRKAREPNKDPVPAEHWSNRIMDRDLVNIIAKVLTIETPKPVYLATDYRPVTTFELGVWLSEQVGETPPTIDNTKTSVTGKRLHSNIPLAWLDYADWQTGYRDILNYQE